MRKTISSAFILLLLLFSLWGLSAWFVGTKTEQNIAVFFGNENEDSNSESLFNYEFLRYERSIFGAKAQIRMYANKQNKLTQFLGDSFENILINFDILHGPILFDKSGVRLGRSALELVLEDQSVNQELFLKLKLNKSPKILITLDFDDLVKYKIPIQINQAESLIIGDYDLKTKLHKGKLRSNELKYQDQKQTIQATDFALNYEYIVSEKNNGTSQFNLTAYVSELVVRHSSLEDKLVFKIAYKGKTSLQDNLLNSVNGFSFTLSENGAKSKYPIEKGDLSINLTALNLEDLLQLNSSFAQLKNLQQQSQWILEEQGEFPEGQDQIWQTQDSLLQYSKQLPKLVNQLLIKGRRPNQENLENQGINNKFDLKNSKLRFLFNTEYSNKKSTLNGAIYPAVIEPNEELLDSSLFSLLQAQAQINLEDEWLEFLSTRTAIRKPDFKLTYRQNKLLMQ